MKYILWLDDMRAPFEGTDVYPEHFRRDRGNIPVLWARDCGQAMWYADRYGTPDFMCLDHDLGYPPSLGGDTEETVMKFLRYLSETRVPCDWRCHSANPVGVKNVDSFMTSWLKSEHV